MNSTVSTLYCWFVIEKMNKWWSSMITFKHQITKKWDEYLSCNQLLTRISYELVTHCYALLYTKVIHCYTLLYTCKVQSRLGPFVHESTSSGILPSWISNQTLANVFWYHRLMCQLLNQSNLVCLVTSQQYQSLIFQFLLNPS